MKSQTTHHNVRESGEVFIREIKQYIDRTNTMQMKQSIAYVHCKLCALTHAKLMIIHTTGTAVC